MSRTPQPASNFAETALGAVVLLSLQFLSLPLLAVGLALIGGVKLVPSGGPAGRR